MTSSNLTFGSNRLLNVAILIFYIFGMWPREYSTVIYKVAGYSFHILFTTGWVVAKIIGTAMLKDRSDLILLGPSSLYCIMSVTRIFIVMENSENIRKSFNQIIEFELNGKESRYIKTKIETFSSHSVGYVVFMFGALGSAVLTPFFEEERVMPIPIWFPLDYKNNAFYFWIGYWYSFLVILTLVILDGFTPILIWFLMYGNALKLRLLSNRIAELGYQTADGKNEVHSYGSLYKFIKMHEQIVADITDIQNVFSVTFLIQITTSGICICSVIYLIASENVANNINIFIMYFSLMGIYSFEIFLLMYYGNEVTLASENLFTGVYKSNWMDASLRYRKTAITFMERLKRPQEMKIGKVFPMNLNMLTSILNVAYSSFNLLRSNEQK